MRTEFWITIRSEKKMRRTHFAYSYLEFLPLPIGTTVALFPQINVLKDLCVSSTIFSGVRHTLVHFLKKEDAEGFNEEIIITEAFYDTYEWKKDLLEDGWELR